MKKILCVLVGGFVFLSNIPSTYSAPFTFLGEDLLSLNNVEFPNGAPSLEGTSIRFAGRQPADALLRISLDDLVQDPLNFSISVNATRLATDTDFGFFVTDGVNIAGGFFGDNSNGSFFEYENLTLSTDGLKVVYPGLSIFSATGLGFPPIGGQFQTDFRFVTTDSSVTTTVAANGSFLNVFDPRAFNLAAGLDLIFVADRLFSPVEDYQINSITFNEPAFAVSAPPVWLLSFIGFGAFAVMRRRLT